MNAVALPNFRMEQQRETNWCWAAVSASVNDFYRGNPVWSQCAIAASCLGRACCFSPEPCDTRYTLEHPLSVVGHLAGHGYGPLTFPEVAGEIDRGAVVCCHIAIDGGGGHFVAIVGYDPVTRDVLVKDPARGDDTLPFDTFVHAYNGTGRWDYTYFTGAYAGGLP